MPILTTKTYPQVRHLMQPGDVIAFGGDHWMSAIIKDATKSTVSHVGVVHRAAPPHGDPTLVEATVAFNPLPPLGSTKSADDRPVLGVHEAPCDTVLAHYAGDAWWLPLGAAARTAFDAPGFDAFITAHRNRLFDPIGGGGVLLRRPLRRMIELGLIDPTADDLTLLFCSELVAGCLAAAAVVPAAISPSDVSPAELCAWAIYDPTGWHLQGTTSDIPGFNTTAAAPGGGDASALRTHVLRARAQQKLAQLPVGAGEILGLLGGTAAKLFG